MFRRNLTVSAARKGITPHTQTPRVGKLRPLEPWTGAVSAGVGMTIYTLGSINIDHVYRVATLPRPGETMTVIGYMTGLGGKGANQSIAAARMGASVRHIGAVGQDGGAACAEIARSGVDITHIARADTVTGHAIVVVDDTAENLILIHPGANHALDPAQIETALAQAQRGDTLLLQNETTLQDQAARIARGRGMRVIYSAAPFAVDAVRAVLPHVSLLMVNEGEAAALSTALGAMPDVDTVVTRGRRGAEWLHLGQPLLEVAAFPVHPVDTTGAGDCFAGVLAAALDAGMTPEDAMRRAAAAAALQVTRPGAAPAMPTGAEVDAFLSLARE